MKGISEMKRRQFFRSVFSVGAQSRVANIILFQGIRVYNVGSNWSYFQIGCSFNPVGPSPFMVRDKF